MMSHVTNRQPTLKPQDLYLLLALLAWNREGITYPGLAELTGLSVSEVHGALKRAAVARLLYFEKRAPAIIKPAFREFLFHGARYAFPVKRGTMVGGVPTAYAAPPLKDQMGPSADPPPVWPCAEGSVRGIALIPLYPTVPAAALRAPVLYENLALFDALRSGNSREQTLARRLLEERM